MRAYRCTRCSGSFGLLSVRTVRVGGAVASPVPSGPRTPSWYVRTQRGENRKIAVFDMLEGGPVSRGPGHENAGGCQI